MKSSHQPVSRRAKAVVVVAVAAMLGYFAWFQLLRDEPPLMPPGFVLPGPLPPLNDADNGLAYLEAEIGKVQWPEIESADDSREGIIRWSAPWDEELMRPVVEAAPAMRKIVENALRYPEWRLESGLGNRSFYRSLFIARDFIRTKIRQLAEANNADAAMDWLALELRQARRHAETPVSFAGFMIATGAMASEDRVLMRVLGTPGVCDAELLRGSAMLEPPVGRMEDLVVTMAREYQREADLCFDPREDTRVDFAALFGRANEEAPPEWLVKSRFKLRAYHNLRLRHFSMLDRFAKHIRPEGIRELRAAQLILKGELEASVWSFHPNRAGSILAATWNQAYFTAAQALVATNAARSCRRAVIAAKRWSLAHGGQRVPSLADLVPEFLSDVPVDPYDGRPLRWDAATGTAYVIGYDGVDSLPTIPQNEPGVSGEEGAAARLP